MTTNAESSTGTHDELRRYAGLRLEHAQAFPLEQCKICDGDASLYDVLDFARSCESPSFRQAPAVVPVYYRRCRRCGFVFTDFFDQFTPNMWTRHLYNDAYYAEIDPDYAVLRPQLNAAVVDALLCADKGAWTGLDYGGGNGQTAQRLRALGYTYDTHDPYGLSDLREDRRGRYDFCSTFEVAEHTPDPLGFLHDIVRLCSPDRLAVLVGTHTSDGHIHEAGSLQWWYAAPRNGHISLYTRRALQVLAERFSLQCHSISEQTHLFTRGYTAAQARRFLLVGKLRGRLRRLLRPAPARS